MNRHLHIIWAIALKDITDAIKNRTILAILFSMLFLLGMYRLLPVLENLGQAPNVLIYDAGDSALVAQLEDSPALAVWAGYQSEAHMQEKLASGQSPELGLVIPADFDAGSASTLQGYVLTWVSEDDATALRQRVEAEISRLAGRPVALTLTAIPVPPDSSGFGLLAGMAMTFAILMIGISLVPNLMLEEQQGRTLDALLVSPAGPVHITLAKGLAGFVYAAVTVAVALALYSQLVTQWALTIGAALCGGLFAVALGLLLGMLTRTRQQLTLWAWGVVVPLFLPLMLMMLRHLLPAWLLAIFHWLPSVALLEALLLSFSPQLHIAHYGALLAVLLAWTVGLLVAVAWRVRQTDR